MSDSRPAASALHSLSSPNVDHSERPSNRRPLSNPRAAFEHVRLHVVPVLGVGVALPHYLSTSTPDTAKLRCYYGKNALKRCAYQIVLLEDKKTGDWVVHKSSTLRHDHGPRSQILADPSWRPPTFANRLSYGRKRGRREASSVRRISRVSGYARACSFVSFSKLQSLTLDSGSEDADDDDDGEESESDDSFRPSSRTRAIAKRSAAEPVAATSTKKHKASLPRYHSPHDAAQPHPYQPTSIARLSAANDAFPSPAPTTATSSRDITPSSHRIGPSVTITTPDFVSTLVIFLTSVHPALGALGSALYEAGVKDMALLVRFVGMEEKIRDIVLEGIKMGLLLKHLLKKELKAARDKGWAGARER